ncbi:MAG: thioredoxin [Chloroflexi bacterium]|nr:thioredoxin [Chloroflexota bacterium]
MAQKEKNAMVIEISDKDFEQQVLKSSLPVVVDFWAPWCGPCRMIGPIVEKLSEEFKGKLKFCKVNVDENQQLAQKYKVMSIPTLIFFKNGQLIEQSMGAVPEKTLRSKVQGLL